MQKFLLGLGLLLLSALAEAQGQAIQIYANFDGIIGKPIWTLMIRDLDHNQMVPYQYSFDRKNTAWTAFTLGHHYQIVASTLQISLYLPETNNFYTRTIHNFCNLETAGNVTSDRNLWIKISGYITPFSRSDISTYLCTKQG